MCVTSKKQTRYRRSVRAFNQPVTILMTAAVLTRKPELPPAVAGDSDKDTEKEPVSKRRVKNRRPDISDTIPAIPVAAFSRLVREIANDLRSELRWEASAIEALQVDAEAYLIERLDSANKKRLLSRQKTLGVNHFKE